MSPTPQGTSGLAAGTVIDGRYRVLRLIGSGGFARVYEATHLVTDRQVALKVLDAKATDTDGTFAERFLREARIAASLSHPNVVRIFDVGSTQGNEPYIAMELLSGHDLGHEIAHRGPMHPDRAFRLFRPVLEALAHGHRQGIVHKDLKPANLFLNKPGTDEETLVILDFGVARVDAADIAQLTDDGQLLGTPRYLAPEYIREQRVTPAIDVYQIALIIAEALAAYPAVEGNPYTSMMKHCQGELHLPDALTDGSIGEVFATATALDPDARYPDAHAFGEALDDIDLAFRSMAPQPAPEKAYREVRSTQITGEGRAPETSTDSMPMAGLDLRATPGPISAPNAMPGTMPPFMLPPSAPQRRSPAVLIALLGVGVLVAGGVLAWFMVLRPSASTGTSEAAEPTEPAPAAAVELDDRAAEPGQVRVIVSSEPSPATYYLDGVESGTTPAMFDVEAGQLVELRVEFEGYMPFTTMLNTASNTDDQKIMARLEPEPQPEPPPATEDDGATAQPDKGGHARPAGNGGKPTPRNDRPPRERNRDRSGSSGGDDGGGWEILN